MYVLFPLHFIFVHTVILSSSTFYVLSTFPSITPSTTFLPVLYNPTISSSSLCPSSSPPFISSLPFHFCLVLRSSLISSVSLALSILSLPLSLYKRGKALSVTVGLFVYRLQGHVFAKSEITEDETMWWSSPHILSMSSNSPLSILSP